MGIFKSSIWMMGLAFLVSGCDQFSTQFGGGGGGGDGGTNVSNQDKRQNAGETRNRLLAKLQGLDQAARLQMLLSIIQDDADVANRRDAVRYVEGLGAQAVPIADSLARLFVVEKDHLVAGDIKQALTDCGANVEESLLSLAASAQQPQLLRIVEALGFTGASSPAALEFLGEQLDKDDTDLVLAACKAIEQLGPAAKPLLPWLIAVAERPRVPLDAAANNGSAFRASRDTTGSAVRAIAAVGADPAALSVLTKCLAMEPNIAEAAAKAIADLGSIAAPAIPALQQLLNRDDHGGKDVKTRLAREAAQRAIGIIDQSRRGE